MTSANLDGQATADDDRYRACLAADRGPGHPGGRRAGAHSRRPPRNRLGAGRPEGHRDPPGDEAFHVAVENDTARHFKARIAVARCRLWPPIATRPPVLPLTLP